MTGLNRRIHPRSLTDERGTVLSPDGAIACVVRDRSLGGARVVTAAPVKLAPFFELRTARAIYDVELIWSDGRQAGVRFRTASGAGTKPDAGAL